MGLPLYLALAAPELSAASTLPKHLAYMACHFSSFNNGLSNFPQTLPEGSMLILNDSTPALAHDPLLISRQLAEATERLHCCCVLLDFQRPANDLTFQIAEAAISALSCPVAVSEQYAIHLKCPVFLSALPADCSLKEHLKNWQDRKIYLEAALDASAIIVDRSGSRRSFANRCDPAHLPHRSQQLHCHYKMEVAPEQVCFTLQRTGEDLKELLAEAEKLGVVGAVGLYQELGTEFHCN